MALRGFHSKSSSSTASRTEDSGAAKVADMPAAAPGDEQRLAFDAGEVEKLRDHRTESAAGHDDGPFCAEWSAGADGDGCGERLQNRQPRMDTAAIHQNGFDRFRNAVSADALGPIARHEPDNQRSDDRHRNCVNAEMIPGG